MDISLPDIIRKIKSQKNNRSLSSHFTNFKLWVYTLFFCFLLASLVAWNTLSPCKAIEMLKAPMGAIIAVFSTTMAKLIQPIDYFCIFEFMFIVCFYA